jgi:hypothetical protein
MAKTKKKGSGIDFKQILLQKGERYGFYAAGGLLVLLVVWCGMVASSSASSGTIVQKFDKSVTDVQSKINSAGDKAADLPGVIYGDPTVASIPFTKYEVDKELWNIAVTERTKRGGPKLFRPTESHVDVVKGPIGVYDVQVIDGEVWVTVVKERAIRQNSAQEINRLRNRNNRQGQAQPTPAAPSAPVGGAQGGGLSGGPGGRGGPRGGGMGGMAGQQTEIAVETVKLTDKALDQATLAETIDPRRLVVVTASIPYKAQVEEYRKKLLAATADALSEFPEYRGFVVERQILKPDGKTVEQDWSTLDFKELKELYPKVVEYEPETAPRDLDPDLRTLYSRVVPPKECQLVHARPKIYEFEYPSATLPSIVASLRDLKKVGAQPEIRTEFGQRFSDEGDGIFGGNDAGAGNAGGGQGAIGAGGPGRGVGGSRGPGRGPGGRPPGFRGLLPPAGGAGGENGQAQRAEDETAWMMRFIDLTAEPGHAYKYRVTLRALNPNFEKPAKELAIPSLAREQYIYSEPYEVPDLATLPKEEFLYAAANDRRKSKMTEKMPGAGNWDETWVQMQRWYSAIRPEEFDQPLPFGEWLVADIKAIRGQAVGERDLFTFPLWDIGHAAFLFRDNVKRKGRKPSPDWTITLEPNPPMVLVDFEGGTGKYMGPKNRIMDDSAGVEMLFMTNDGKLQVSRSGADTNDPDRTRRYETWEKWLLKVNNDTLAAKNRTDSQGGPRGPGSGPGGPPPGGRPGG